MSTQRSVRREEAVAIERSVANLPGARCPKGWSRPHPSSPDRPSGPDPADTNFFNLQPPKPFVCLPPPTRHHDNPNHLPHIPPHKNPATHAPFEARPLQHRSNDPSLADLPLHPSPQSAETPSTSMPAAATMKIPAPSTALADALQSPRRRQTARQCRILSDKIYLRAGVYRAPEGKSPLGNFLWHGEFREHRRRHLDRIP